MAPTLAQLHRNTTVALLVRPPSSASLHNQGGCAWSAQLPVAQRGDEGQEPASRPLAPARPPQGYWAGDVAGEPEIVRQFIEAAPFG